MDPDECMRLAQRAMEEGFYCDAVEHITDLTDWVERGGFMPASDLRVPMGAPRRVHEAVSRLYRSAGQR
jgi:hypothetical protein